MKRIHDFLQKGTCGENVTISSFLFVVIFNFRTVVGLFIVFHCISSTNFSAEKHAISTRHTSLNHQPLRDFALIRDFVQPKVIYDRMNESKRD